MRRLLLVIGAAALTLGTTAGVALAQTTTTNYPGPTTPTTAGPSAGSSSGPTISTAGQSFTAEECGFPAGGSVGLTLNGGGAGGDTADSDGCARQVVAIVTPGQALGRQIFAAAGLHLAARAPVVSIEGRQITARLGTNTILAAGVGSNGASRTFTVTFNIVEPSGGGLVRTGVKIAGLTVVGLALVVGGFLLVGASRKRKHAV